MAGVSSVASLDAQLLIASDSRLRPVSTSETPPGSDLEKH